jgi:hypothetical protein
MKMKMKMKMGEEGGRTAQPLSALDSARFSPSSPSVPSSPTWEGPHPYASSSAQPPALSRLESAVSGVRVEPWSLRGRTLRAGSARGVRCRRTGCQGLDGERGAGARALSPQARHGADPRRTGSDISRTGGTRAADVPRRGTWVYPCCGTGGRRADQAVLPRPSRSAHSFQQRAGEPERPAAWPEPPARRCRILRVVPRSRDPLALLLNSNACR